MKPEKRLSEKGKGKLYRVGRPKTFFDNHSKLLNMSYRDISIFLGLLLLLIVGLFIGVIVDFIGSFRG